MSASPGGEHYKGKIGNLCCYSASELMGNLPFTFLVLKHLVWTLVIIVYKRVMWKGIWECVLKKIRLSNTGKVIW